MTREEEGNQEGVEFWKSSADREEDKEQQWLEPLGLVRGALRPIRWSHW